MTDITKLADFDSLITELEDYGTGDHNLAALLQRAAAALRSAGVPQNGVGEGEIPYKVIVELYNSTLSRWLPKAVTKLPAMRRRILAQRWQEDSERRSIGWWADYWIKVSRSDFLCGRQAPNPGHENWRPNFDWLINATNLTKVVEGSYDRRAPQTNVDSITRFR